MVQGTFINDVKRVGGGACMFRTLMYKVKCDRRGGGSILGEKYVTTLMFPKRFCDNM